jgi:hypothetical protein
MYYIGAYIKIGKPQLHPTATLSSGGISAMAFFYLVSHNRLSSIYFEANLHYMSSGPSSTHLAGMARPGSSTPKCSLVTHGVSLKHLRRHQIGYGTL